MFPGKSGRLEEGCRLRHYYLADGVEHGHETLGVELGRHFAETGKEV